MEVVKLPRRSPAPHARPTAPHCATHRASPLLWQGLVGASSLHGPDHPVTFRVGRQLGLVLDACLLDAWLPGGVEGASLGALRGPAQKMKIPAQGVKSYIVAIRSGRVPSVQRLGYRRVLVASDPLTSL
jgi:hypothetical protein